MKRFYGLFISLLFTIYSFADYTGVITTNISELTFGEQDGYDVLTLPPFVRICNPDETE